MTHPDFKSGDYMIELHALKQWFIVYKEGNKDYFFDAPAVAYQERSPEGPKEDQRARVTPVVLELGARMGQMNAEELATVAMTTNVDNENKPSPEVITRPNA